MLDLGTLSCFERFNRHFQVRSFSRLRRFQLAHHNLKLAELLSQSIDVPIALIKLAFVLYGLLSQLGGCIRQTAIQRLLK